MAWIMSMLVILAVLMVSPVYSADISEISSDAEEESTLRTFDDALQELREKQGWVEEEAKQPELTFLDQALGAIMLIAFIIVWTISLPLLFLLKGIAGWGDKEVLATAASILAVAFFMSCRTAATQWKANETWKEFLYSLGPTSLWLITRPTVWPIVGCGKVLNWATDVAIIPSLVAIITWNREKIRSVKKQLEDKREELDSPNVT